MYGTPGTTYGYCPHCEHRRELVPNSAGYLQCHSCDAMDVYDSKAEYEQAQDAVETITGEQ